MSLYRRTKKVNGEKIEVGPYQYLFYIAGKRYRRSTETDNIKEAERIEKRAYAVAEKGESLTPRKAAVLRDFSDAFFKFIDNSRLENQSKRDYHNGWRLLKKSKLAGMRLDQITADDVETTRFLIGSEEDGGLHESPYSTNCAIRTIRRMLHKAKDWKMVREIPRLNTVEAPPRTAMFSPEIEQTVLDGCQQPLRDVVMFVVDTGMRDASEVVKMRWEYTNLSEGYYHNPKGKTERARRVVPLSERVIEALKARDPKSEGWVFRSEDSTTGHISAHNLQLRFRLVCRRLGIADELKIYSGRHTFGNVVMEGTGNPFLVQNAMGHADLETTRGYMHTNVRQAKAVIDRRNKANQALRVMEKAEAKGAQKDVVELRRLWNLEQDGQE